MTQRQERAIRALLECRTKAEAAQTAGVGVSTLRRWMRQDAAFMAAYREAVDEVLESTTRKAQSAVGQAIDILSDIMKNPDEQAGPRVSAADKVLGYSLKLTEQNDVLARMSELERIVEELEGEKR